MGISLNISTEELCLRYNMREMWFLLEEIMARCYNVTELLQFMDSLRFNWIRGWQTEGVYMKKLFRRMGKEDGSGQDSPLEQDA